MPGPNKVVYIYIQRRAGFYSVHGAVLYICVCVYTGKGRIPLYFPFSGEARERRHLVEPGISREKRRGRMRGFREEYDFRGFSTPQREK